MYADHIARAEQCRYKRALSVRNARDAWRTWRETRDPAWRFLAREALADARYWRAQLERVSRA